MKINEISITIILDSIINWFKNLLLKSNTNN